MQEEFGRYKQQQQHQSLYYIGKKAIHVVVVCHFHEIFASCELIFPLSQSLVGEPRNFLESNFFSLFFFRLEKTARDLRVTNLRNLSRGKKKSEIKMRALQNYTG